MRTGSWLTEMVSILLALVMPQHVLHKACLPARMSRKDIRELSAISRPQDAKAPAQSIKLASSFSIFLSSAGHSISP